MRNLLALIGLLVVGFLGIGWYCGWYRLSITRTPDGNLQVNTSVDTNRIGQDSTSLFKKIGQAMADRTDNAGPPAGTPGPAKAGDFDGGWLLTPTAPTAPTPAAPPTPPKGPIKLVAPGRP